MQRQNRNEAEEGGRDALITVFSNSHHDGCVCRKWPCCSHGKTIDYEGWIAGKVIFDGKIHGDKGLGCTDCHPKVFPMKKETKITMAKINEGKYWGPATMVRRLSNRANRLTAKDAIIRLQLIQKH